MGKQKKPGANLPEKINDFAAIFISQGTEVEGAHGTIRGVDWPDYWWYSVLSLERAIKRKLCGSRIANGDICTEDPGTADRCSAHATNTFAIPSNDSVFNPEAAKSLLLNRLSLSFARSCDDGCPAKGKCGDSKGSYGDACYREVDIYNQLIMNKLADAAKVGINLTFTQISSIRRLCINEILMMRNDGIMAKEGTTIRLEKTKTSKYGDEFEEHYIISPALLANSALTNDNRNLSRESLLTAKVQHESKIAQENAMAEAAKAESQKQVGNALMHVLKEVNALPGEVPGVGSMDEILATHRSNKPTIIDVPSAVPGQDSAGTAADQTAQPGDIVIDEDNNHSMVNDKGELQPLPTRKEVDL